MQGYCNQQRRQSTCDRPLEFELLDGVEIRTQMGSG
jgi:hypothetical protein